LLDVSDDDVDTLNSHFLGVKHICAEAIIRNYRVCILLRRFDEFLKRRFGLLLVGLKELLKWYVLDALPARVLEHPPTEPDIVISVDKNAQIKQISQLLVAED
jgi:hypothetical protein